MRAEIEMMRNGPQDITLWAGCSDYSPLPVFTPTCPMGSINTVRMPARERMGVRSDSYVSLFGLFIARGVRHRKGPEIRNVNLGSSLNFLFSLEGAAEVRQFHKRVS
ncbi:unnamed protein product [Ectocarpus sp. 8 AP-2014]